MRRVKIIGKIIIFLILLNIMISFNVFAVENDYQGMDTTIDELGNSQAAKSSQEIIGRVLGVFQVVGTIIAVIALIIIGMRYMLSSVEEKASLKGTLVYYLIGAVLVLATPNVIAFIYNVVDQVNHDYQYHATISYATCVSEGKEKHKCNDCGKEIEISTPIDSDNHNMSSWVIAKNETCTEDGTETRTCTNGCGKKETKIRNKQGHDYEFKVILQPTCTETGYEGDKCKRCEKEKKYSNNSKDRPQL